MADPFSIFAAAISLADVVFERCRSVYQSLAELREISEQVKHLAGSMQLWSKISQRVKNLAQRYESSPFAMADAGLSADTLCDALHLAQTACYTIDILVKDYKAARARSKIKLVKDIKWMLDAKKLQAAQARLDQAQQSLLVALSTLGNQDMIGIGKQCGLLQEDARRSQNAIYTKIQSLNDLLLTRVSSNEGLHDKISEGLSTIKASQQENSRLLQTSVTDFQRKVMDVNTRMLQQSQQSQHYHDRAYQKLAVIEARLATLNIIQNESAGDHDCTVFAGQNLEHILQPLLMIKPSLFPFLMEIVRERKIYLQDSDVQHLYAQFLELLALCKRASADEDLRERRGSKSLTPRAGLRNIDDEWHGEPNYSTQPQRKDTDTQGQLETRKLFSVLRRKGVWTKRLPQGVLRIQFASMPEKGDFSNGLCAVFTFLPLSGLSTSGLTMSYFSGLGAFFQPQAFCNIRSFNWLVKGSSLYDEALKIFRNDDTTKLQQSLVEGKLTLWDREEEEAGFTLLGFAANWFAIDCFRLLLQQGAPMHATQVGSFQSAIASIYWRGPESRIDSSQPWLSHLCELAIQYGADLDDWAEEYSALGHEYYMRTALGPTPLHTFAFRTETEDKSTLKAEIQYLLDKGFNINEPDENNRSPLLYYMRWGLTSVVENLEAFLELGADATVLDTDGCNALHLLIDSLDCLSSLCIWSIDDYQQLLPALLKTLLKYRCSPDHVNNQGVSVSMRMRHTVVDVIWAIWISVLKELDLLQSVDTNNVDEVECLCVGLCIFCNRADSEVYTRREKLDIHSDQCEYCGLYSEDIEQEVAQDPAFWNGLDLKPILDDTLFAIPGRRTGQVEELIEAEACMTDDDSDGGVAIE